MKRELKMGIIILLLIYPILSRFTNTFDLILGFLMGLGLIFTFVGLIQTKTHINLKDFKK